MKTQTTALCANLSIYFLQPCSPTALFSLRLLASELPLQLQLLDQLFSSPQGLLLSLADFLHLQLQLLLSPRKHLPMKKTAELLFWCSYLLNYAHVKFHFDLKPVYLLHEPFSGFPLLLPLRFSFLPHMLSFFSKMNEVHWFVFEEKQESLPAVLMLTCEGCQTQPPSPAPSEAALQSHVSSRQRQRWPFPFVQSPSSGPPALLPARLPVSYGRPPGWHRGIQGRCESHAG